LGQKETERGNVRELQDKGKIYIDSNRQSQPETFVYQCERPTQITQGDLTG